jgi:hypothetical protein
MLGLVAYDARDNMHSFINIALVREPLRKIHPKCGMAGRDLDRLAQRRLGFVCAAEL